MKIFIDPGHGGKDPGAIGKRGTQESDVVLGIAKELAAILNKDGFITMLSRNDDSTLSLADRAALANNGQADLFISIHCNGFTNSGASGTEVYSHPNNAQAAGLAKNILNSLCSLIGTKSRGTKTENFAVLRLAKMPAVLIETAFITNETEENIMLEPGFAAKAALGIAEGIYEYLGYAGKAAEAKEHWGKEYLDKLKGKGFISNEELWSDFEGSPTNAMVLALIDKITEAM